MDINIAHLAKLARLRFSDQELEKFTKDMQNILGMVENLPPMEGKQIGLDPEHPMALREDQVSPSLKREKALSNAPQTEAGCIVVPKTVE